MGFGTAAIFLIKLLILHHFSVELITPITSNDFKIVNMARIPFLFLVICFCQNCTVYKIINITNQNQTLSIGMKIHDGVNTKNPCYP